MKTGITLGEKELYVWIGFEKKEAEVLNKYYNKITSMECSAIIGKSDDSSVLFITIKEG
jgi:hypothetical protein